MTAAITVAAARLPLLLGELRLPTIGALWPQFTERADSEGWPAAKLLATLAELELAERSQRRIQRHLAQLGQFEPDFAGEAVTGAKPRAAAGRVKLAERGRGRSAGGMARPGCSER